MSTVSVTPQPIKPTQHPLLWASRWVRSEAWRWIMGPIFGVFAVAGIYWLIFESRTPWGYPIHSWWHTTFSNDLVRHNLRALLEGSFGGLLGTLFAWNHYKKGYLKKPKGFQKFLSEKVHFPLPNDERSPSTGQFIAAPFLFTAGWLAGLAIVVLITQHLTGYGLGSDAAVPGFVDQLPHGVLNNTAYSFLESWPVRLQGFMAVFFGRYLIRGVIDDAQLWYAQRRAIHRHWQPYGWLSKLLPPGYACRYEETIKRRGYVTKRSSRGVTLWLTGTAVLLLSILGFCAINFNLPHA